MSQFFVLLIDPSRDDLQSVIDDDLDGFDGSPLQRGYPLQGLPAGLRLFVSDKPRADLLGNAFGWKIMSERAVVALRELVPAEDVQVFPLTVISQVTREPVVGYHLLNCLQVLSAFGGPLEGMKYANQLVVNDSCVPPDTHLFRMAGVLRHWIASEQLWCLLSGLNGFGTVPARTALFTGQQ